MGRFAAFKCAAVFCFGLGLGTELSFGAAAQATGTDSAIVVPAGTRVELAVTVPVWAAKAKPGDPVYTQTNFPVVAGGRVAIPPGSWVEGTLESITKPTRKTEHAELAILFNRIVLAGGTVVNLPSPGPASGTQSDAVTAALITVQVSTWNDLLLDNGAQIEMTLASPVMLDAAEVSKAIPLSRAPQPGQFKSATLCRPTPASPGTPGTPDTVIPGSPGTPSTTIPGGPGMPDITIPGTPATPDTVIPGMPGTPGDPGSVCPAAPMVLSSVPATIKPGTTLGTVH
jgi:hypothetical protein